MTTRLGGTGVWSSSLRYGDAGEAAERAAELEALGYSALWIPDVGGDRGTRAEDAGAGPDAHGRHASVVWGDEATIATRVQAHRDAGADHVCVQVLTDDPRGFATEQWKALAGALVG